MRRALLLALLLGGCAMTPRFERPAPPIPASWPVGDPYLRQSEAALPARDWRTVFADARLQRLIETALANNRDLRVAAANIAVARADYRIQRAEQLPLVAVGAGLSDTSGTFGQQGTRATATVGIPAFELDLFGRLAALTDAQRQTLFATEAAARTIRLALVADIAQAWSNHATDAALLAIAEQTLVASERSVTLTRARLRGGIAPRTDLRQAEQVLATAQVDRAVQRTALAQDVNALRLLLGSEPDVALLPASQAETEAAIALVPAGLASGVLLRRPDVVAAEFRLRAANAQIGAARAALFPRITLTGVLGLASDALGGLLSGAFTRQTSGAVNYPIFAGGAARAGVEASQAQRDALVAGYERTIQTAFREVADALARGGTIADERAAARLRTDAAADTARLSEARYRGGVDSFLATLDAQRSLYTAQRAEVGTRANVVANRIALYRALGDDSTLPSAPDARNVATSPAP